MTVVLSGFFFLAAFVGTGIIILQITQLQKFLSRPPRVPKGTPGISLLKPLCGVDDDLEENLKSFVALDYPLLVETALGALTVLVASALALGHGPARLERAWLLLAFVALLAASLFRCRNILPDLGHATSGSRYSFAPS